MSAKSNCKVLGINSVFEVLEKQPQEPSSTLEREDTQEPSLNLEGENPQEPSHGVQGKNTQQPSPSTQTVPIHIDEKFVTSYWYAYIVHFLIYFECPAQFSKNQ